jgi:hypothetical protein
MLRAALWSKWLFCRSLQRVGGLCRCDRSFDVGLPSRAEIAVQCRVRGVKNEMAVAAFAEMPLNLIFNRRREFSL